MKRFGKQGAKVDPHLALLIECKRSVHPYVFFQKIAEKTPYNFPVVTGVDLSIEESHQGVGRRSYPSAPIPLVLNLDELPFFDEPPLCAAFAKATLDGKKVQISGEEPAQVGSRFPSDSPLQAIATACYEGDIY